MSTEDDIDKHRDLAKNVVADKKKSMKWYSLFLHLQVAEELKTSKESVDKILRGNDENGCEMSTEIQNHSLQ
jgi:hypothetical protein